MNKSKGKVVRYNKWGYIFLIPFIVVYVVFQLIPLISTIYNSFFENYMSGLDVYKRQIWDRTDFRQDFMRTGMTVCVWAKMESPRLLHCSFIMQ